MLWVAVVAAAVAVAHAEGGGLRVPRADVAIDDFEASSASVPPFALDVTPLRELVAEGYMDQMLQLHPSSATSMFAAVKAADASGRPIEQYLTDMGDRFARGDLGLDPMTWERGLAAVRAAAGISAAENLILARFASHANSDLLPTVRRIVTGLPRWEHADVQAYAEELLADGIKAAAGPRGRPSELKDTLLSLRGAGMDGAPAVPALQISTVLKALPHLLAAVNNPRRRPPTRVQRVFGVWRNALEKVLGLPSDGAPAPAAMAAQARLLHSFMAKTFQQVLLVPAIRAARAAADLKTSKAARKAAGDQRITLLETMLASDVCGPWSWDPNNVAAAQAAAQGALAPGAQAIVALPVGSQSKEEIARNVERIMGAGRRALAAHLGVSPASPEFASLFDGNQPVGQALTECRTGMGEAIVPAMQLLSPWPLPNLEGDARADAKILSFPGVIVRSLAWDIATAVRASGFCPPPSVMAWASHRWSPDTPLSFRMFKKPAKLIGAFGWDDRVITVQPGANLLTWEKVSLGTDRATGATLEKRELKGAMLLGSSTSYVRLGRLASAITEFADFARAQKPPEMQIYGTKVMSKGRLVSKVEKETYVWLRPVKSTSTFGSTSKEYTAVVQANWRDFACMVAGAAGIKEGEGAQTTVSWDAYNPTRTGGRCTYVAGSAAMPQALPAPGNGDGGAAALPAPDLYLDTPAAFFHAARAMYGLAGVGFCGGAGHLRKLDTAPLLTAASADARAAPHGDGSAAYDKEIGLYGALAPPAAAGAGVSSQCVRYTPDLPAPMKTLDRDAWDAIRAGPDQAEESGRRMRWRDGFLWAIVAASAASAAAKGPLTIDDMRRDIAHAVRTLPLDFRLTPDNTLRDALLVRFRRDPDAQYEWFTLQMDRELLAERIAAGRDGSDLGDTLPVYLAAAILGRPILIYERQRAANAGAAGGAGGAADEDEDVLNGQGAAGGAGAAGAAGKYVLLEQVDPLRSDGCVVIERPDPILLLVSYREDHGDELAAREAGAGAGAGAGADGAGAVHLLPLGEAAAEDEERDPDAIYSLLTPLPQVPLGQGVAGAGAAAGGVIAVGAAALDPSVFGAEMPREFTWEGWAGKALWRRELSHALAVKQAGAAVEAAARAQAELDTRSWLAVATAAGMRAEAEHRALVAVGVAEEDEEDLANPADPLLARVMRLRNRARNLKPLPKPTEPRPSESRVERLRRDASDATKALAAHQGKMQVMDMAQRRVQEPVLVELEAARDAAVAAYRQVIQLLERYSLYDLQAAVAAAPADAAANLMTEASLKDAIVALHAAYGFNALFMDRGGDQVKVNAQGQDRARDPAILEELRAVRRLVDEWKQGGAGAADKGKEALKRIQALLSCLPEPPALDGRWESLYIDRYRRVRVKLPADGGAGGGPGGAGGAGGAAAPRAVKSSLYWSVAGSLAAAKPADAAGANAQQQQQQPQTPWSLKAAVVDRVRSASVEETISPPPLLASLRLAMGKRALAVTEAGEDVELSPFTYGKVLIDVTGAADAAAAKRAYEGRVAGLGAAPDRLQLQLLANALRKPIFVYEPRSYTRSEYGFQGEMLSLTARFFPWRNSAGGGANDDSVADGGNAGAVTYNQRMQRQASSPLGGCIDMSDIAEQPILLAHDAAINVYEPVVPHAAAKTVQAALREWRAALEPKLEAAPQRQLPGPFEDGKAMRPRVNSINPTEGVKDGIFVPKA